MKLSWLQSIIYGFISGLADFLPVSSNAHQYIMLNIFGAESPDPVRNLFVHIGLLLCVITCSRTVLEMIKRDHSYSGRIRTARHRPSKIRGDALLVRKAALPMVVCMLFLHIFCRPKTTLISTAILFILNGIILFLPDRMMRGNKNAGLMSPLDGILIGSAGGLSVLTGFSRFGCTYSISVARGAEGSLAFTWSLLLSIPALICVSVLDVFSAFSTPGILFWQNILGYFLSGIFAFGGAYLGISAVRSLIAQKNNLSAFAYYCWGCGLISFLIYLIVA